MIRSRIASLTGIRGVAASLVVLMHFSAIFNQVDVFGPLSHMPLVLRGYLAVDLFFVLSGFVLAANYAQRFAEGNIQQMLKQFWILRISRIMPLNTVCLVLFLCGTLALGPVYWTTERLELRSFIAALLLVQSWGVASPTAWNLPAWSLSTEWLAYTLFPVAAIVVMRVGSARQAALLAGLSLALLAVTMAILGDGTLDHTWKLGLPRCLLQFGSGMLVWRCLNLAGGFAGNPDVLLAAGITLVAIAISVPAIELLAPLGFAVLVAACSLDGRVTRALFGNRIIAFLGEISFSLYLVHFIAFGVFVWLIQTNDLANLAFPLRAAFGITSIASVFVLATLTWLAIELPGQRLGRDLASHTRTLPPVKIRASL